MKGASTMRETGGDDAREKAEGKTAGESQRERERETERERERGVRLRACGKPSFLESL